MMEKGLVKLITYCQCTQIILGLFCLAFFQTPVPRLNLPLLMALNGISSSDDMLPYPADLYWSDCLSSDNLSITSRQIDPGTVSHTYHPTTMTSDGLGDDDTKSPYSARQFTRKVNAISIPIPSSRQAA